ncbi:MAG: YqeG family HAD IIIA-type phosphatase [archaeon]
MADKKELPYPSFSFYMRCLSPKNITPKMVVGSINDIFPNELEALGIRALVIDVDNTICPYGGVSVDERVEKRFRVLTKYFKSCLLSNTDAERMRDLERYFGIPAIQAGYRKPLPGAFIQALDYLGTEPRNTAMIGDRLLSDIAGANMIGLLTIKVDPLSKGSEPRTHSVVRRFEDFVLRLYLH